MPLNVNKLKHLQITGQNSPINYSRGAQGHEEGEKFPRVPYKIYRFCGLLSSE